MVSPKTDRHWSGLDPFHAPSRTTDYYGSGDVDLDGTLTSADLALVREMIAGTRSPVVRADVDGNGIIDNADLALLQAALQGGTLPGWWDRLSTPMARADWIRRVAAIDLQQLVSNKEADRDWVCDNYATRTFLRFAPQVLNPANPAYERYGVAQSTFNLPVYVAEVTAPDFGHSLNAILIGDDPAVFTNWFLLEPQAGAQAQPGDWNLPWGAQVHIQRPDPINAPYQSAVSLVGFQLAQPAAATLGIDPNLLRQPSALALAPIHNNPNSWQPVLLPEGNGMLLFNKTRDDMLRPVDLHLLTDLNADPNSARALLTTGGFHRLVAIVPAAPGNYHLLWVGHTNWQQQLYYGRLELGTGRIQESWVVATNVAQGRLLGISTNEVFVFYPTDTGLVCSHKLGSQWKPAETVVQWTTLDFKLGSPCFAVTTNLFREPRVIWADQTSQTGACQTTIFEVQRHNGWQAPQTVDVVDGFIPTLDLAQDSKGTLHLVYANTWFPAFEGYSANLPAELWQVVRGPILYRARDQAGWGAPQIVATDSFWPTLLVTRSDKVILSWETDQNGRVVPVWADHTAGTAPQVLSTQGTPYYPALTEVATGALLLAWTEASQWGATANYQMVQAPETISMGISAGPDGLQLNWRAQVGGSFQVEYTDAMDAASWQPLLPVITLQTNQASLRLPLDSVRPARFFRVKRM